MLKLYKSVRVIFFAGLLSAAGSNAAEHKQMTDVVRIVDGEPVGIATTIRTSNRVQTILRTSDLDPGSAVTVWWRVYNRPRLCAIPYACTVSDLANPDVDGSQLHATAVQVSESDGTAVIVASLYRTAARAQGGGAFADSLVEGHLSGRGLRRPLAADLELVIVSHGRIADPAWDGAEAADEQLLTPGGSPIACADPAITSGRSFRCGALQIANIAPAGGR